MIEVLALSVPCVLLISAKYIKNRIFLPTSLAVTVIVMILTLLKQYSLDILIQLILYFGCLVAVCIFLVQNIKTKMLIFTSFIGFYFLGGLINKERIQDISSWLAYMLLSLIVIAEIYEYRKNK